MSEMDHNVQPSFQTYQEAVDWIIGLVAFGIKPGMQRVAYMMEELGHPERRLKFIHVAGTNGKGSTCAYLDEVLRRSGYDVGMFTSPYIERFTDRIRYNGEDIPQAEVLRISNQLKPLVDKIAASELGSPTMFEVCTVLAILYFATSAYPDYVVWETGLGGRMDVTNIVTPVISVITNIGHDHMEILGDTLEKVAVEKAGIIKPGVPVVSAVEQPEVMEIIRRKAAETKSSLYLMGEQFTLELVSTEQDSQKFHFQGPFRRMENVTITLNGAHQLKNASVALMTLEVLRQYYALIVDEEALYPGMRETRWAGRLEMISDSPRLLIDGAHNPEGARTLADALQSTYRYKKLHLMIGMLATKNHHGYLGHILPLVDTLIITEPDWRKKVEAEQLAKVATEVMEQLGRQVEIRVESDWRKALQQLLTITGEEELAVVSGTLYLISDVRSYILYQSKSEKGW